MMAFPNEPSPVDEAMDAFLSGRAATVVRVHMAPAQPKYRRVIRPWVVNLCWVIVLTPVVGVVCWAVVAGFIAAGGK